MKKLFTAALLLSGTVLSFCLPSPSKRGMCYNSFTEDEVKVLEDSNITWAYNWYQNPGKDKIGPDHKIEFMPMIWGAGEDFDDMVTRTKEYLAANKNIKCLLGFNEPMMKAQYGGCALTPKEAAEKWPVLEQIAEEYKVELAGPALTWGFEPLSDGKIYGAPEAWMDEFISEYKKLNKNREPRYDYIVLHSYMDYPSAVMWFCSTYGNRYNKKVLLTEFCAWDQDPNQIPHQDKNEQITAMTQKVEAMDTEEIVEGYAWFMSHAEAEKIPYNSVFTKKGSDGSLTDLGKVYLYMTDVSRNRTFTTKEIIPAYEYASSSNYNTTVGEKCDDGLRFNTPVGIMPATDRGDKKLYKKIPLELGNFSNKRFANYKVNIPSSKKYTVSLRIMTDREELYIISADGKEIVQKEIPSTKGKWKTVTLEAELNEGIQEIQIKTLGNARTAKFYWFTIE